MCQGDALATCQSSRCVAPLHLSHCPPCLGAVQGLLGVTVTDLRPEQLAAANWSAVPDTLPVIMLSFVYHNIVGTIATSLEGDVGKIR